MENESLPIEGYVARIVTDDELIINKGSADGVNVNMIFSVLDPRTQDIRDPITGENLGSIERHKAQVRVTRISDRISMARITPARRMTLSDAASVVSGVPRSSRLTSNFWPEGVQEGDPVRFSGKFAPQA
jgi:hypothetical protein